MTHHCLLGVNGLFAVGFALLGFGAASIAGHLKHLRARRLLYERLMAEWQPND